ncbi:inner membrane protein YhjD [Nocardia rhizosphaerihabitans]|uniref:Inner membrane protein YhjD n=1 Tax=Nocardia rhizosphaerihabitans TaxID=1691570 RepID=A0ABQ2KMK7_9NOCA|nr:inner membrane protein YhjD [Nocardia rhizosphaerihabitans]GGN86692.1 inner membrane protein YhjD [Nocardia rhizosphaerihabitans]
MQVVDNISAAVEKQIGRRPWLDHLVRAGGRFQRQRGDYFAAGITYFTVLSLFPLLMVAFSVAGFILAGQPDLLTQLQESVKENIPGSFGTQINDLIDQAIRSRGTVGLLGLVVGLYTGLGWIANLRAALTEQWEVQSPESPWWRSKLSDVGALIGLGLASVVSLGLSALAQSDLGAQLLAAIGADHLPGATVVLSVVSIGLGLLASWAVFAWMIARLPREPVSLRSAARAAALAAIAFEVFKVIAAFYLQIVLRSPAGATFGSIIGLMVFSYITYRILLFATAWAATSADNERSADIAPPNAVVIRPRVVERTMSTGTGAAYFGAGAIAALALMVFGRRR